ncbi:muraminidase [Pandoraea eparura]|uniref:Lysozyme n=1 Tax=Pandoraea eparura TaxID=2508291 RepID=A0A5E4X1C2_9BURK|nr:lysozyme [Pandoraea eparura]VVE30049.1 muraminidase [Pandoraea eparura]
MSDTSNPLIKRAMAVAAGGAVAIAAVLVPAFEGSRLSAYLDPVGIPTICYGHTAGVRVGQVKSQAQCDELLRGDLGIALTTVDRLVKVPMPETRRAALASFVYNAGAGNFASSTMLRKLNAGDPVGACNELPKWVYSKGQILPGLVQRREQERQLCLM